MQEDRLVQLTAGRNRPAGPRDLAALTPPSRSEKATIQANYGKLPLYFIENQGQVDAQVALYIQTPHRTVYFTPTGVTFVIIAPEPRNTSPEQEGTEPSGKAKRWVVKLDFVGASAGVRPAGRDLGSAVVSYFKGPKARWKTGLRTYGSVIYEDLWPGIDLVYTGEGGQLKATYVVKPGADPKAIRLAYQGPGDVAITDQGWLGVSTPLGGFSEEKPYAYQETGGSARR